MVTNFRHGTSKAGNPYGIFTLEDYVGAFEFPLFGKNYIEYGKYMIKDLYVFIHAIVQERGADFKYKKVEAVDPNIPKELELKIQKVEVFSEIKDKLINTLTLTIPIQQMSDDLAVELTELVVKNKGNVNLYIQVVDETSPNKVMLFARQHRIQINKKVYNALKHMQSLGSLDFQVQ